MNLRPQCNLEDQGHKLSSLYLLLQRQLDTDMLTLLIPLLVWTQNLRYDSASLLLPIFPQLEAVIQTAAVYCLLAFPLRPSSVRRLQREQSDLPVAWDGYRDHG